LGGFEVMGNILKFIVKYTHQCESAKGGYFDKKEVCIIPFSTCSIDEISKTAIEYYIKRVYKTHHHIEIYDITQIIT
jgi:hypothetical protein